MSIKEVKLKDGLTVGGVTHTDVSFKDLAVEDILEANEASERVITLPDGSVRVATSEIRLGVELLRRRICKLGDLKMPLSMVEFKKLSEADLGILQDAVEELDILRKLAEQGRDEEAL